MDRWKSRGGKSQRREEQKKEDQRKEKAEKRGTGVTFAPTPLKSPAAASTRHSRHDGHRHLWLEP
jgi:hypothetical protein